MSPKASDICNEGNLPRYSAWLLLSSIRQSLSKRKTDTKDDMPQSTLAADGSRYKGDSGRFHRGGGRCGGTTRCRARDDEDEEEGQVLAGVFVVARYRASSGGETGNYRKVAKALWLPSVEKT